MQKQRSRTSTGWTGTALKCGAVALGAGLLSATALTSAQADDSAATPLTAPQTATLTAPQGDAQAAPQAVALTAPQAAAQGTVEGTVTPYGQDAAAPGTEAADPAQDAAVQEAAPADALAATPGKVTAQSGLFVHDQARLTSARVGTLVYGANVSVWCAVTTDIRWYRIQMSPQRWAAANYIAVPAGSKIPNCTSLGLSDGLGGDEGTEPMAGSGSSYNGDSSSIGPIIVTNQFDNRGTTSSSN